MCKLLKRILTVDVGWESREQGEPGGKETLFDGLKKKKTNSSAEPGSFLEKVMGPFFPVELSNLSDPAL